MLITEESSAENSRQILPTKLTLSAALHQNTKRKHYKWHKYTLPKYNYSTDNKAKTTFPCAFCPKHFYTQKRLELHAAKHHGQCFICLGMYLTFSDLMDHIQTTHKCHSASCDLMFQSEELRTEHYNLFHRYKLDEMEEAEYDEYDEYCDADEWFSEDVVEPADFDFEFSDGCGEENDDHVDLY